MDQAQAARKGSSPLVDALGRQMAHIEQTGSLVKRLVDRLATISGPCSPSAGVAVENKGKQTSELVSAIEGMTGVIANQNATLEDLLGRLEV